MMNINFIETFIKQALTYGIKCFTDLKVKITLSEFLLHTMYAT